MTDGYITRIRPDDSLGFKMVDALLEREGIRRDTHLDYTCAMYDGDGRMIATGSCFGSTLRCFAVSAAHRGEGLMNQLLTHLIHYQAERGNYHLFLYTKPETATLLGDLGFYEIARVPDRLVFMENRRTGFSNYLQDLAKTKRCGVSAAIVMNANPFTLGHQYLAEQAAAQCDVLHLFIVSEDVSDVPSAVRRRLAEQGTAHIPNVVVHDCGPYLISAATFPDYFLKKASELTQCRAMLDAELFKRISEALGVTSRWVGEEPDDPVTALYNRVLAGSLPEAGIRCVILPRKEANGQPIRATVVRELFRRGDMEALRSLVPRTTLDYLCSPEAEALRQR